MFARLMATVLVVAASALQGMPERPAITVSAAISLTDALTAAAREFARAGGGAIRFNFGPSNAVESRAADAAIVYRTDARMATRATIAWIVPADRGPTIVYPAGIVRASKEPGEARRFIDFLRSAAGARVFERFGFGIAR